MYESDPNSYVNAEHAWFDPKDAESKRTLTKTYTYSLFFVSGSALLHRNVLFINYTDIVT